MLLVCKLVHHGKVYQGDNEPCAKHLKHYRQAQFFPGFVYLNILKNCRSQGFVGNFLFDDTSYWSGPQVFSLVAFDCLWLVVRT